MREITSNSSKMGTGIGMVLGTIVALAVSFYGGNELEPVEAGQSTAAVTRTAEAPAQPVQAAAKEAAPAKSAAAPVQKVKQVDPKRPQVVMAFQTGQGMPIPGNFTYRMALPDVRTAVKKSLSDVELARTMAQVKRELMKHEKEIERAAVMLRTHQEAPAFHDAPAQPAPQFTLEDVPVPPAPAVSKACSLNTAG